MLIMNMTEKKLDRKNEKYILDLNRLQSATDFIEYFTTPENK